MADYGRVDVCVWSDRKFRALSPAQPCGQMLWLYLLAPRERTMIPGLLPAGIATVAESLRWPYEATAAAFAEIQIQRMAEVDSSGPLIWLPNAIKRNLPSNQNQVTGWGDAWAVIPECPLKHRAWTALRATIASKGEQFAAAFAVAFPEPGVEPLPEPFPLTVTPNPSAKGSRKGSRKRSGNGGGNHEHEQEHDRTTLSLAGASTRAAEQASGFEHEPAESPGAERPEPGAAQANAAGGGESPAAWDGGDAASAGIAGESRGAAGPTHPRSAALDRARGRDQSAEPNHANLLGAPLAPQVHRERVMDDDVPRRPLVVLDAATELGLTPRELGTLHRMGMQAPQDRYPGTAAVIAELRSLGWEVAWPRDGSRPAVEAAIVHATVPVAVQRLMAVPLAVRLANPWLGWHLRAIAGEAAGKGGGRGASDVRVGVGVPSPAESFQGGERELTKHS
jgi:hypothetical protein